MKTALLLLALTTTASAQSVTLTQDQLQRLILGEQAKAAAAAVSQYIAQEKESANKDVYDLVKSAFTPKPKELPHGEQTQAPRPDEGRK